MSPWHGWESSPSECRTETPVGHIPGRIPNQIAGTETGSQGGGHLVIRSTEGGSELPSTSHAVQQWHKSTDIIQ